jgi:predicted TPR repeat methyltransferase
MDPNFELARNHFIEGVRAFESGAWAEAETQFMAALERLPGRPSTLMNLAAVRTRLGRPAEALPLLDQALASEPASVEAWCHRGAALAALHRPDAAVQAYDQALALAPGLVQAHFHRALQLNALGRPIDALAGLDAVLTLRPDDGEALFHQGQTLQALGRPAQALHSYERLLGLNTGMADAWSQRGGILKDLGRLPEAAACFRQALAHGGDAELNTYFLASVEGGTLPETAPRGYVQGLFDSYAADFDDHLANLGYRTPQWLAALLPPDRRFASALDLGCGTGLMAPLLQPLCTAIDGVDLSSQMLAKAQAAGLYRRLHHGDVAEYLSTTDERYDLIVAADVFVYVGALDAVFAGAARVLQPGGCFFFSVEEADAGERLQLRASSRYAHAEDALRTLATAHGLVTQHIERQTLRHDQRRPIGGLLVRMVRG